jgi:hypothetical protein
MLVGLYPMVVPPGINYPSAVGIQTNQSIRGTFIMKSTIISLFCLCTLGLLSSCTFVENRDPSMHTTRTTTAEVTPATYGTVETKTTRTY